jgi:hypothetical protein
MDNDFSMKKEGEFYSLQKLTYPRFNALFNFNKPLPQLITIELLDNGSAKEIDNALREMERYLNSKNLSID